MTWRTASARPYVAAVAADRAPTDMDDNGQNIRIHLPGMAYE